MTIYKIPSNELWGNKKCLAFFFNMDLRFDSVSYC